VERSRDVLQASSAAIRHCRLVVALLLTAAFSASVVAGALAAAGDLDPTFGGDGTVTARFLGGEANVVGGVAMQADGKIVVAGGLSGRFALMRFNADGTRDETFSGSGKVTTDLTGASSANGWDEAHAVAIQADGKVVAVGEAGGRGGRFAIVRYKRSGKLDDTFSSDGKRFTNFSSGPDVASGIAIQTNGKIVAVGGAHLGGLAADGRFALARYNTHGTLDKTFGGDGKVMTNFTPVMDVARGVAIQSDGKILAAGGMASSESGFALARYKANGTLDSSFDGDGRVTTDFPGIGDSASGIAIQTDGKIVAAGDSGEASHLETEFALARYNEDGSPDASFGGDGTVTTNFTDSLDRATGVAIQSDGKIVAAGSAKFDRLFAVARYDPLDGTLDTSFGGDGKVTTNLFSGYGDSAKGVAIQADGKIVVAGDVGFNRSFAVVRYLGG
jgi:uncharacterized delta-60 repeat protein